MVERLDAVVQPYAWGDRSIIAELQRRTPTGEPEAELWMGAHPKAPSRLPDGRTLDQAIAADPQALLGTDVADTFGKLPFLFKVLAAAEPLSIQTHPTLAQAQAGWARENAAGMALDDPQRTYRDDNHKPELICALTRFHATCGFRPIDDTRELLVALGASTTAIRDQLTSDAPAQAMRHVLGWLLDRSADHQSLVESIVQAAASVPQGSPWQAELSWTARIAALHPGDVGVVVALLLNHVVLEPGQAMFLEAGVLHSYLQGAGIEVMANSDNVVRGGLTPKHVDADELARIAITEPRTPRVQTPHRAMHEYESPVPEFSLARAEVQRPIDATVTGPEIILVTDGLITLSTADGNELDVRPGEPVWVPASDGHWHAQGIGTIFRCSVPAQAA